MKRIKADYLNEVLSERQTVAVLMQERGLINYFEKE